MPLETPPRAHYVLCIHHPEMKELSRREPGWLDLEKLHQPHHLSTMLVLTPSTRSGPGPLPLRVRLDMAGTTWGRARREGESMCVWGAGGRGSEE